MPLQVPVWTPRPWRPSLGQAATLEVVVVDADGAPVKNALVSGSGVSGYTDDAGIVKLALPARSTVTLTVQKDEYRYEEMVQPASSAPVYLTLPVHIRPNGIKTAEIVIFVAGIGLVGAGAIWKLDPLKMVGEIVVSAVIFAMIYRLAAR